MMPIINFGGKLLDVRVDNKLLQRYPLAYNELIKVINTYKQKTKGKPQGKIEIEVKNTIKQYPLSKNPNTHVELQDGFMVHYPRLGYIGYLRSSDGPTIVFRPNKYKLQKSYIYKIANKEFSHPYQYLNQILHEQILIPMMLTLFEDRIIIHGSALFDTTNERAIPFSGTGGVGKTFMEMSLLIRNGKRFKFFSDDMIVMGKGKVYPNLSPPPRYINIM